MKAEKMQQEFAIKMKEAEIAIEKKRKELETEMQALEEGGG